MVPIRAATRADIEEILTVWREAATVPSATDDADGIAALLEHDPAALLVAPVDGRIAGTVIVGWDGWRGTMYRLAVVPALRRRGIATMLVAAGEQSLRDRGARRLHLIAVADEEPARAFWSAAGYQATDQLRFVKTL